MSIRANKGLNPMLINKDPVNFGGNILGRGLFVGPGKLAARISKIFKVISNNALVEFIHMGGPMLVPTNLLI